MSGATAAPTRADQPQLNRRSRGRLPARRPHSDQGNDPHPTPSVEAPHRGWAQERENPACAGISRGADERTRTADPFITSEVLYQLSYVGKLVLSAGPA